MEFEAFALSLMEVYGGKLLYRLRPTAEQFVDLELGTDLLYEIHLLTFPSEEDLTAFMQDKRKQEFLHLKEDSVSSRLIIKGFKV